MAVEYKPKQEDLSNIQDLIGGLDNFVEPPLSIYRPSVDGDNGEGCSIASTSEESPVSDAITRTEILDFGDEGFLLENVLDQSECQFYIKQGDEAGFHDIPDVKKTYRNSERILFECEHLASGLWKRILPFLKPIVIDGDPHLVHIHGIESLLQGSWMPYSLNPVFRLCRYEPGGHFAPHYDGHLVADSRCRSLQTFMLYLNGSPDFQKGSTNFVKDEQVLYTDSEGKYCAEEKNILYRIEPKQGRAIVFNHHRLHEGEAVIEGLKYILRTDIMFKNSDDSMQIDPKEEEALQLVQQAERLEALGDNMEAMQLYRKAFKLSPSLAKSYGN